MKEQVNKFREVLVRARPRMRSARSRESWSLATEVGTRDTTPVRLRRELIRSRSRELPVARTTTSR
jgi:hypothetical protein